jgi:hypothetical protein
MAAQPDNALSAELIRRNVGRSVAPAGLSLEGQRPDRALVPWIGSA